eukprot:EST45194.1 Hypothetical protein SS50377_14767 [Spironucleus salmonicida]
MNYSTDSIRHPYIQADTSSAFYRNGSTALNAQEHYLFITLFYWYGSDFYIWQQFIENTLLPQSAIINYYNLNYPQLVKLSKDVEYFANSLRGQQILQYYSQFDFFTSITQVQTPILSNFGSVCRVMENKLSQFTGKIVNPILIKDYNFDLPNGLLIITPEERMFVNILKSPIAGLNRVNNDRSIDFEVQPNSQFFSDQKQKLQVLQLQEVKQRLQIQNKIVTEIFNAQNDQQLGIIRLLDKLIKNSSTQQQVQILQELMDITENNQDVQQQVKKLRIALGKPVMSAWAKYLYDKLISSQNMNKIINISQFSFLQQYHQGRLNRNFFDGPVLATEHLLDVPHIPELSELQLAIELYFSD